MNEIVFGAAKTVFDTGFDCLTSMSLEPLSDAILGSIKEAVLEYVDQARADNQAEVNFDQAEPEPQLPPRCELPKLKILNLEANEHRDSGRICGLIHFINKKGVIEIGELRRLLHGERLAQDDTNEQEVFNGKLAQLRPVQELGIDLNSFKEMVDTLHPAKNKGYVRFARNGEGGLKLEKYGAHCGCLNMRINVTEAHNKEMRMLFAETLLKDWGGLAGIEQGGFHSNTLKNLLQSFTGRIVGEENAVYKQRLGIGEVADLISDYENAFHDGANNRQIAIEFLQECCQSCLGEELPEVQNPNHDQVLAQVNELLAKHGEHLADEHRQLFESLTGGNGLSCEKLLNDFGNQLTAAEFKQKLLDVAKAFLDLKKGVAADRSCSKLIDQIIENPTFVANGNFVAKFEGKIGDYLNSLEGNACQKEWAADFVQNIVPTMIKSGLARLQGASSEEGRAQAREDLRNMLGADKFRKEFEEYCKVRKGWEAQNIDPFQMVIDDKQSELDRLQKELNEKLGDGRNVEENAKDNPDHTMALALQLKELGAEIKWLKEQQRLFADPQQLVKSEAKIQALVEKSGEAKESGGKQSVKEILTEGVGKLAGDFKLQWLTGRYLKDRFGVETRGYNDAKMVLEQVKGKFTECATEAVRSSVGFEGDQSVSEFAKEMGAFLMAKGVVCPLRNKFSPKSMEQDANAAKFAVGTAMDLVGAMQRTIVRAVSKDKSGVAVSDQVGIYTNLAKIALTKLGKTLDALQDPKLLLLRSDLVADYGSLLSRAETLKVISSDERNKMMSDFKGRAFRNISKALVEYFDGEFAETLKESNVDNFQSDLEARLKFVITNAVCRSEEESLEKALYDDKLKTTHVEVNNDFDFESREQASAVDLDNGNREMHDLDQEYFPGFEEKAKQSIQDDLSSYAPSEKFGLSKDEIQAELEARIPHAWKGEVVANPPGKKCLYVFDLLAAKFSSDDSEMPGMDGKWIERREAGAQKQLKKLLEGYKKYEQLLLYTCRERILAVLYAQIPNFAGLHPELKKHFCDTMLLNFQDEIHGELKRYIQNPRAFDTLWEWGAQLDKSFSMRFDLRPSEENLTDIDNRVIMLLHLQDGLQVPSANNPEQPKLRTSGAGVELVRNTFQAGLEEYRDSIIRHIDDPDKNFPQELINGVKSGLDQVANPVLRDKLQAWIVKEMTEGLKQSPNALGLVKDYGEFKDKSVALANKTLQLVTGLNLKEMVDKFDNELKAQVTSFVKDFPTLKAAAEEKRQAKLEQFIAEQIAAASAHAGKVDDSAYDMAVRQFSNELSAVREREQQVNGELTEKLQQRFQSVHASWTQSLVKAGIADYPVVDQSGKSVTLAEMLRSATEHLLDEAVQTVKTQVHDLISFKDNLEGYKLDFDQGMLATGFTQTLAEFWKNHGQAVVEDFAASNTSMQVASWLGTDAANEVLAAVLSGTSLKDRPELSARIDAAHQSYRRELGEVMKRIMGGESVAVDAACFTQTRELLSKLNAYVSDVKAVAAKRGELEQDKTFISLSNDDRKRILDEFDQQTDILLGEVFKDGLDAGFAEMADRKLQQAKAMVAVCVGVNQLNDWLERDNGLQQAVKAIGAAPEYAKLFEVELADGPEKSVVSVATALQREIGDALRAILADGQVQFSDLKELLAKGDAQLVARMVAHPAVKGVLDQAREVLAQRDQESKFNHDKAKWIEQMNDRTITTLLANMFWRGASDEEQFRADTGIPLEQATTQRVVEWIKGYLPQEQRNQLMAKVVWAQSAVQDHLTGLLKDYVYSDKRTKFEFYAKIKPTEIFGKGLEIGSANRGPTDELDALSQLILAAHRNLGNKQKQRKLTLASKLEDTMFGELDSWYMLDEEVRNLLAYMGKLTDVDKGTDQRGYLYDGAKRVVGELIKATQAKFDESKYREDVEVTSEMANDWKRQVRERVSAYLKQGYERLEKFHLNATSRQEALELFKQCLLDANRKYLQVDDLANDQYFSAAADEMLSDLMMGDNRAAWLAKLEAMRLACFTADASEESLLEATVQRHRVEAADTFKLLANYTRAQLIAKFKATVQVKEEELKQALDNAVNVPRSVKELFKNAFADNWKFYERELRFGRRAEKTGDIKETGIAVSAFVDHFQTDIVAPLKRLDAEIAKWKEWATQSAYCQFFNMAWKGIVNLDDAAIHKKIQGLIKDDQFQLNWNAMVPSPQDLFVAWGYEHSISVGDTDIVKKHNDLASLLDKLSDAIAEGIEKGVEQFACRVDGKAVALFNAKGMPGFKDWNKQKVTDRFDFHELTRARLAARTDSAEEIKIREQFWSDLVKKFNELVK